MKTGRDEKRGVALLLHERNGSRSDLTVGLILIVALRREPAAPCELSARHVSAVAFLAGRRGVEIFQLVVRLRVIHLAPHILQRPAAMKHLPQAGGEVAVGAKMLWQRDDIRQFLS